MDASTAAGFKYRAFISYSHRDERRASWLHKSIEGYRVPKPLIGQPSRDGAIPSKLFPVFRDRDELASSPDLSTSLTGDIDRRCSPRFAGARTRAWRERQAAPGICSASGTTAVIRVGQGF